MGYDTLGKRERWKERAEAGDVYSQYELAQSYCCGIGEGVHDNHEAMKWWCKAGKNGYAKAQIKLGQIYERQEELEALNVKKDLTLAYMWYELAKRRGNEKARENYFRLKQLLTKKQIDEGEKLLEKWKTVPCGSEEKKS